MFPFRPRPPPSYSSSGASSPLWRRHCHPRSLHHWNDDRRCGARLIDYRPGTGVARGRIVPAAAAAGQAGGQRKRYRGNDERGVTPRRAQATAEEHM